MKSRKPRQPCKDCGRVPRNPRVKNCPFCAWQLKVAVFVLQQRNQQEQYKRLRLQSLRVALRGASEFLKDFDMTAINHAIEDAAARPVIVKVFKDEDSDGK